MLLLSITLEQHLLVQVTSTQIDGSDVVITWQGDAEDWAILHNGEQIGTTAELKFRHTPTIEGQHNYSVLAIMDGQVIQDDSAGRTSVELTTSVVAEAPGPSETAGLVFSIVMLLIGLVGIGSHSCLGGIE